ncbi:RNase H-like domain found in reverse transcriptase [Popillia japonica]|uniref:RNase H-like domain found in reverse transcriptase n=1 Tax=Popillia japonica TaxID=7064 RepID=A0AAW1JYK0_POPJA
MSTTSNSTSVIPNLFQKIPDFDGEPNKAQTWLNDLEGVQILHSLPDNYIFETARKERTSRVMYKNHPKPMTQENKEKGYENKRDNTVPTDKNKETINQRKSSKPYLPARNEENKPLCFACKKYGHVSKYCSENQRQAKSNIATTPASQDYAKISKPLTKLLSKSSEWIWGNEQEAAFEKLKQELAGDNVLILYSHEAYTELHTDASQLGLGAALLQRGPDGLMRPVVYISRQTTPDESKYHANELETLCVIC